MTSDRDWMPTIIELTERLFDNELSAGEQGTLNQLLSQGPQQRRYYLAYANLLITLERRGRVAVPPVTFSFDNVMGNDTSLASIALEAPPAVTNMPPCIDPLPPPPPSSPPPSTTPSAIPPTACRWRT